MEHLEWSLQEVHCSGRDAFDKYSGMTTTCSIVKETQNLKEIRELNEIIRGGVKNTMWIKSLIDNLSVIE